MCKVNTMGSGLSYEQCSKAAVAWSIAIGLAMISTLFIPSTVAGDVSEPENVCVNTGVEGTPFMCIRAPTIDEHILLMDVNARVCHVDVLQVTGNFVLVEVVHGPLCPDTFIGTQLGFTFIPSTVAGDVSEPENVCVNTGVEGTPFMCIRAPTIDEHILLMDVNARVCHVDVLQVTGNFVLVEVVHGPLCPDTFIGTQLGFTFIISEK